MRWPTCPGNGLDGLHAGRAGADHGDALAGEIDGLLRPSRGVEGGPPEIVAPLDPRQRRRRQRSNRGNQESRAELAAVLQGNAPAPRALIVSRRRHPAAKLDIAAQVELVGDIIEVAQRLRLTGEMLGPLPFLQQLLRERIAIGIALRIEARAGIAIPVPGAADIGASLEYPHAKTLFAQPVELVQARHARADDDGVVVRNWRRSRVYGLVQGYPVSRRWTNRYRGAAGLQVCPTKPASRRFTAGRICPYREAEIALRRR